MRWDRHSCEGGWLSHQVPSKISLNVPGPLTHVLYSTGTAILCGCSRHADDVAETPIPLESQ